MRTILIASALALGLAFTGPAYAGGKHGGSHVGAGAGAKVDIKALGKVKVKIGLGLGLGIGIGH